MPPGCAIRLDRIAQEIVVENLRASLKNTRRALIDDLRGLPASTTLGEFLEQSAFALEDVYSTPASGTTFASARRAAGHLRGAPGANEAEYAKALGKVLHVDDEERYVQWRSWLTVNTPPAPSAPGSREERLQWMLFAALGQRKRPLTDLGIVFGELWRTPVVRAELIRLLDVLRGAFAAASHSQLIRSALSQSIATPHTRCMRPSRGIRPNWERRSSRKSRGRFVGERG